MQQTDRSGPAGSLPMARPRLADEQDAGPPHMLRAIVGILKPDARDVAIPMGLAFAASMLEGASLGLLKPLTDVILSSSAAGGADPLESYGPYLEALPESWGETVGPDAMVALGIVGAIFLLRLARMGLEFFRINLIAVRNQRYRRQLANHAWRRALHLSWHQVSSTGATVVRDQLQIVNRSLGIIFDVEKVILMSMRFVAQMAVMAYLAPWFTLATCLILPMILFASHRLRTEARRLTLDLREAKRGQRQTTANALNAFALVKVLSLEGRFEAEYDGLNEKVEDTFLSLERVKSMIAPLEEGLFMICILFLLVGSLWFVPKFEISQLAAFCAFLVVALRAMGTLETVVQTVVKIDEKTGELDEANLLMDAPHEEAPEGGARTLPEGAPHEALRVKSLSFSYRKGVDVLRDVSLTIPAGKTTVVVGASGSGKTTLLQLMAGLLEPPEDAILVDDVDLRALRRSHWHEHVAMVTQSVCLLDCSLRENLLLAVPDGAPTPSDDELLGVISQARLKRWFGRLGKGLDSHVGERGVNLSGGERQRLAIARSLLRGAPVVFLDEATSGLDARTELRVLDNVRTVTRGRTVVMVTHRQLAMERADWVVVLDRGRVLEEGSYERLRDSGGPFCELVGGPRPSRSERASRE